MLLFVVAQVDLTGFIQFLNDVEPHKSISLSKVSYLSTIKSIILYIERKKRKTFEGLCRRGAWGGPPPFLATPLSRGLGWLPLKYSGHEHSGLDVSVNVYFYWRYDQISQ
jgi:hypothetical protein